MVIYGTKAYAEKNKVGSFAVHLTFVSNQLANTLKKEVGFSRRQSNYFFTQVAERCLYVADLVRIS